MKQCKNNLCLWRILIPIFLLALIFLYQSRQYHQARINHQFQNFYFEVPIPRERTEEAYRKLFEYEDLNAEAEEVLTDPKKSLILLQVEILPQKIQQGEICLHLYKGFPMTRLEGRFLVHFKTGKKQWTEIQNFQIAEKEEQDSYTVNFPFQFKDKSNSKFTQNYEIQVDEILLYTHNQVLPLEELPPLKSHDV